MLSVVVLSFVIIVRCSQRNGDENYRLPPAEHQAVSPAQYCKHFTKYVNWLNKLQRGAYKTDASAIYYEPVGNRALKILDYPIHFTSDPTTKLYYDNNTPTNWAYQSKPFKASKYALNESPKTKRKNVGDVQLIESNNHSPPLYLDINIQETNENDATRLRTIYQNKMRDLTEKHLKDCLDLHIVFMRNQGIGTLVDGNLSERNKMYNELSDSDLLIEVNKKCNNSAYIVNENFNEIKRKRIYSKKFNSNNIGNKFTIETDVHSNQNKNHSQDLNYDQTENKASKSQWDLETTTVKETTHFLESNAWNNGLELAQATELLNFNEKSRESSSDVAITDTLFTPFSTEITISSHPHTNKLNTSTEFGLEITSSGIEDATTSSIMIDSDVLIPTSTETSIEITNKPDDGIQTNFLEETMTVDDILTTPRVDYFTESTSGISDQIEDENNKTISEKKSFEVIIHVNIDSSFTITNGKNRTEYLEGEYEIPKVITTEFSNDTIVSEVQGNEEVPNLDFMKPPEDIFVPFPKSSDNTTDLFNTNNEKFNNCSKQNETLPSTELGKDFPNVTKNNSLDITGKLYFKYGPQYVPAVFIQKPDGQLNVALDVLSLCDINETSKILQALCKGITFR